MAGRSTAWTEGMGLHAAEYRAAAEEIQIAQKIISFGGIPNSRNLLFLQIFLKRAAKPSAGNTSAGFP